MNAVLTRGSAWFAAAILFAGVVVEAPLVHAEGTETNSLADVPYLPDPGFPLITRRDAIFGGGTFGATAVTELAAGGNVALAGIMAGKVVLLNVTNAGGRGLWPATGLAYIEHQPPAGMPFRSVTDMQVFDGRLYVLVNRQRSTTVTTNDVYVLVFNVDGQFLSSYLAMGEFRDEYGAGIVVYQTLGIGVPATTWVSVVGHRVLDSVESNPFVTRARLEGDTLVRDTSIGDINGYVQVPVPGALCSPFNEACSMEVSSIAVKPTGLLGAVPVLYVGGSIRTSGSDWDFAALCISGVGAPCSGFGNGGFTRIGFNDGGTEVDRGTGIAVRRTGPFGSYLYTVYVAGNVARRCQAGIGVTALDGGTGFVLSGFGQFGRALVGGHNGGTGPTPICFLNDGPDVGDDLAYSNGHLFVAGTRFYSDFGGTAHSDIQSVVLDPWGSVIDGLRAYEPAYPPILGPTPPTESALRSVRTDAAGRFLIAGAAYTPSGALAPEAFVSGRFAQDRIFGNGFE